MKQLLFQRQFSLSYENLRLIRRFFSDKAQALHLNQELVQNIKLVCSEYCANLLEHQEQTASQVTISYGKSDGHYFLSILDNGSAWQHQTEQLQSAELPVQLMESGMGLGLIQATFPVFNYKSSRNHNIITFRIPVLQHRKQIVIVDDSQSQLTLLAHFLEQDYQLALFSKASEALQWLEKNHCDLVLTDLHMPDINGFDFRQRVAAIQHHRLLPFIFLSADTVSETLYAAAQSGIDDFLAKPISKAHLSSVLSRVLERHHHLLTAFEETLQQQLNTQSYHSNLTTISNQVQLLVNQEPCISGDFIMQQKLSDGSQLLLLGDQMGHGIAAKANGAISFGYVMGLLQNPETTPKQVCRALNQYFFHATEKSNLMCLVLLHIRSNNKLTVYNAGMPCPLFFPSQHQPFSKHQIVDTSMGLLGLFDNLEPAHWQTPISSGDSLHCFSDGLAETPFCESELDELYRLSAQERHQYLWQSAKQNPEDDCTLVTVIFN